MTPDLRRWGDVGPEAVLLHCTLASSAAWAGLARVLSRQMQVTAPDLIGHGAAPDWDGAQDYHDQATAAALAYLPDAPCHLAGHSFGGTIALRIAIEQPARVASLTLFEPVLFAAASGLPGRAINDANMARTNRLLSGGDLAAAATSFLADWGGGVDLADMPAHQQSYITDRISLIGAQNPSLYHDSADLLPRLAEVSMPVHLIEGEESPPVVAEVMARLATDLPTAKRTIIPKAAHMAPLSHPGPCARAILALAGLS